MIRPELHSRIALGRSGQLAWCFTRYRLEVAVGDTAHSRHLRGHVSSRGEGLAHREQPRAQARRQVFSTEPLHNDVGLPRIEIGLSKPIAMQDPALSG
jgi:hypothetical protein